MSKFKEKLTEKMLEEHINELFFNAPKEKNYMCYANWCETNGLVMRSERDLNICSDPNCSNCRELEKSLKDIATND